MAILQRAIWLSSWACSSLAAAALTAFASPADARENSRLRIDIDAVSLPQALAELSREAQVSIGTEGTLPQVRVRPLHGRLDLSAALSRLLRGTGYVARQVGPTAWRIEPERAAVPHAAASPTEAAAAATPEGEIVVSATKRDLTLEDAPLAVTIVPVAKAARYDPQGDTGRIAEQVEGLALTGQGPGRNRMFLRGVADSAFGGKSQATVAVLLDDARLTYVAPDPDIRLVDVDRVELLKGPQGSLYGTGALGGIYRIVTNRADPSAFSAGGSAGVEAVAGGGLGGSGSAVVNLPLIRDVSALRLVAYGESSPGWLDTGDRKKSNGTAVFGMRAGLGIEAGGGWRVDATGLGQWLHARDSNYTYRPEADDRPAQLPEPHSNDLLHGSLRIAREGTTQIVFSTGYTAHDVDDRYDATQGAESFGLANPQTLDDDAHYRLWDTELRMTGKLGRIGWLGGLSHVTAWQDSSRVLSGTGGSTLTVETVRRNETESALFGEATVPLTDTLDATVGGRVFHTGLHEDRASATEEGAEQVGKSGVTPSASLAWRPRPHRLLYVRYGSAVRPGGTTIDAAGQVTKLDEDQLMTLEGGWRETIGAVAFELDTYQSWWNEIQSDVLLPNGLVEAANVGNGSITGAELSVKAQFASLWQFDGGAMVQSALLTRNTSGLKLHDRRLPVVPSWTLRGALSHGFAVGAWSATVGLSARYVGPARLSFDPALDRPMGDYLETGLSLGATRGHWAVEIEGRNLLNGRGDSFVYGNPLRIFSTNEFVRQEPFSARLSVSFVP